MEFTEEYLKTLISGLYDEKPTHREFVVHTGAGGMRIFQDEIAYKIEVDNNKDMAAFLYEKKKLTKEEYNNVLNMINSPDRENFEVAKLVLKTISDDLNIHPGKARV